MAKHQNEESNYILAEPQLILQPERLHNDQELPPVITSQSQNHQKQSDDLIFF